MSLFIAVISLSVGYASLSSSLLVSGEAHLRVKEEVRVTNLTIKEQTSSSYDNNSEYYKNGLILRAVLPNKDSKITYTVELTNNSSVDYYLKSAGYKSIEEDVYTEIDKNTMTFVKGDFKYTITGIKTEDTVIKPNKSTFTITITYKDGLTEVPSNNNAVIDIRYEFDILDKIPPVVSFSKNGGCYGSFQTIRVTGYDEHFNHMDIEVYKNGQKVETKTATYPNNSYDISLNEYTEYTIYVKAYDDTGNVQTIGPQDERGYTYQKYLIEEDSEYLYDKVKKCAVSDENVDFSKQPTDDEAEQAYYVHNPIYYYRGPVENNNVIFAGYCWKIVRTTGTGGIKLIYSGKPTSDGKCTATGEEQFAFKSQFNSNWSNKKYVGYMYGDDDNPYENNEPSTIKKNIEAWFEGKSTNAYGDLDGSVNPDYTDLTKYEESFLEDAVWCSDRTKSSTSGSGINYAGYDRNRGSSNFGPSLACPSNDSFTVSSANGNGKSKHKVGMITADELTMGGLNYNSSSSNINTYLYIGGSRNWWALTPSRWFNDYAYVFYVHDILTDTSAGLNVLGVRPMISLQNTVEIETTGDGTTEKPYKVIIDESTSGKKLYDTMISSAKEIVSDENVNFSQQPTNEDANRLYYTSTATSSLEGDYPIYYYRGPVTNNNVIFAGYCWKIVRTTETGGIKLIYSGIPTSDGKCTATGADQFAFNSAFNTTASNKKYEGYMYGEDDNPYENKYPSTIKTNLEYWFEGKDSSGTIKSEYTDLTRYEESFLEDAVWCNDRTEGRVDGSNQYYAGRDRLVFGPYSPSLACPSNDSFTKSIANGNGKLTHKVGMITVDELTMVGFKWYADSNNTNTNTYLYTGSNSVYWWTLSPVTWSGSFANVFWVNDALAGMPVNGSPGVRPMVSLVHDTKVTGSGTSDDPYKVPGFLYDEMLNAATEIVSDEGLDFSQQPTDEDATKLYEYSGETTEPGDKPIYYYRGPVTNNNVIFAGYCWKIVRTTETGGIKLIYSGKPTSDGKCTATGEGQFAFKSAFNTDYENKKYVGYMYGEDDSPYENKYDSTIKKNIEAWFEGKSTNEKGDLDGSVNPDYTDLTQYEESFLEDAVWCNDRTESSTSGSSIHYAGDDRNAKGTYSPSLACPSNDSFTKSSGNGKSNHKVGMISVDELTMGGLNWDTSRSNINTYLYTGNSNGWWSLSPYRWNGSYASVFRVPDRLGGYRVGSSGGVRPLVSLKPGVAVLGGDGNADSPYVIN